MNACTAVVLAAAFALPAALEAQTGPEAEAVPVAPVPVVDYKGWKDALLLANEHMEVIVVPSIGRIMKITCKGSENFLRNDDYLLGQVAEHANDYWYNFGGSWLWPVGQSRWQDFLGSDWPPTPLLDGRPWKAEAWETTDGTRHCSMTQDFGEPLNLSVTRHIQLAPGETRIVIDQKVERTGESDVPVSLWNICQVQGAELAFLPVDEDSSFENGYKVLRFKDPGTNLLNQCGEVVVYHTGEDEHKIGSDSSRSWIGIQKQDMLLVASAEPPLEDERASLPDGCSIELYANAGLGYAEIETLSPEKNLAAGEKIQNRLTLTCYKALPRETPCDAAKQIQTFLGEIALEPAPAEILAK